MSEIWKFFDIRCTICSKNLNWSDGATTEMWKHLEAEHKQQFSQLKSANEDHKDEQKDYDLCEQCRAKTDHPHEMERLMLGEDHKSMDSAASAASRNESVKKCIDLLVHACMCRDANCLRDNCHKMKKVIQHSKHCKRRQAAGSNCAVCLQLISLLCYHAKRCMLTKCTVPFCLQIRQKLQKQSVGAAAMNGGGVSSAPTPSTSVSSAPTPSTSVSSAPTPSTSVSSASLQQQQKQSPWTQPPSPRQQQQIGGTGGPQQQQQPFGAPPMQMSGNSPRGEEE